MNHVKLFENFGEENAGEFDVCYIIVTDEPLGKAALEGVGYYLQVYSLCAHTEEEALKILISALSGEESEPPYMDRWQQNEITTVPDMIKELDGMNGTWKILDVNNIGDMRSTKIGMTKLV